MFDVILANYHDIILHSARIFSSGFEIVLADLMVKFFFKAEMILFISSGSISRQRRVSEDLIICPFSSLPPQQFFFRNMRDSETHAILPNVQCLSSYSSLFIQEE